MFARFPASRHSLFMRHSRAATPADELLRLLVPPLVGACVALLAGPTPLAGSSPAGPGAATDTVIAVIAADESTAYGRGALLGIEEGRRSAELLRSPLRFEVIAAEAAADPADLVRQLGAEGVGALVVALQGPAQEAVEKAAVIEGIVVLDARPAHGVDTPERPGVFRVGLPDFAYHSRADDGVRRTLWHPALFRYGAEQLNERYRRRFDDGMSGEAWAAWMAVKAATEAVLRARGRDIGTVLTDSRIAFDGHKGTPLAFTGPAGTLAQPFYMVEGGETQEMTWPQETPE